jgi:[ribosomal protein S5]-alanine N-acetyltransferase
MIILPIPDLTGLRTERLVFRRLTRADTRWWMGYIDNATAIRFMPFTVGSHADCAMMIQRSIDRYAKDGSGLNALLLEDGTPVGQCGLLTQEVDGLAELEVGYHLLPAFWGKGYASEAAVACKRFAFEHRLAPSVISLIDPENTLSRAVAKKNGMVPGPRTEHRGVPADVWRVFPTATPV